ncbi:ABC transporter permease [Paenibacillus sp. GCM10027626]|uniref:ABC transporter permease n=1 Tax=Paenibacillus sp. GCM10027626 TaxID=3273411 RepID=UPI003632A8F1
MFRKVCQKDAVILFLIALPGILHFLVFNYIPLGGNIIAFQKYSIFDGIVKSPWVGLDNFKMMFSIREFYQILENTLILSFLSIVFGFPAPLVLALLLNEMRRMWLKRSVQTLLYLPHFLSWVIVGGIFINLLSLDGFLNTILSSIGAAPKDFITNPDTFRGMLVSVGIWKEAGWGMIIYLAALAGINPNLYEAAMVDGAGRWRQMWSITLPSLMPAIIVLFLLRVGSVLDTNVEQVLIFINPLVRPVGEVIDTYVYRIGLLGAQFSLTTAIGIFKSVIGLLLIVGVNYLSKKSTGESIY